MEQKTSRNADGAFEPFPADSVPWDSYQQGSRFGLSYQQLGEFGGAQHVGVSREVLAPGKQACPLHYHMQEEEHLLILDGELTLILGEQRYRMQAGDYVCFPAGQQVGHALFNHSAAPCRYLIIGERNRNEVVVYPESGRVGVRSLGQGFDGKATMDYWDGQAGSQD